MLLLFSRFYRVINDYWSDFEGILFGLNFNNRKNKKNEQKPVTFFNKTE